jgi:3-deoxy-D-manno-octulosonate 8-phosphate phosphatase (KDO 8-P phosphatase)
MVTADELAARAARVRVVFTDVDGVLTDAGVYYSARGEELKRFSIRDGMGVERLRDAGIATVFITGEETQIVARRGEKVGARVMLGVKDKRRALARLLEELGVSPREIAYIGDDVNDLSALELAAAEGLSGAPADAMPEIAAAVHHRCRTAGGHGAFREFAEWILGLRRAGSSPRGGAL